MSDSKKSKWRDAAWWIGWALNVGCKAAQLAEEVKKFLGED